MNVNMLYVDRDWNNMGRYIDEKNIVQDLGLRTLFLTAAKEIVKEDGKIKFLKEADPYLEDTMKKVMLVPVKTEEELLYRQEIMRDCLEQEDFIQRLYALAAEALDRWDKLGRRASQKSSVLNSSRNLVTQIHVLQLFVTYLTRLRKLFREYTGKFSSRGLRSLEKRLGEVFSDRKAAGLERILKDVAFYANEKEHDELESGKLVNRPRIILGCGVGAGLKFTDFRLEDLATELRRYRDPNSTLGKAQEYISSRNKDSFSLQKGMALPAQAEQMEYEIVRYVISCCEPFYNEFSSFFDQLHFQAAFYRGAVNLKHSMKRFGVRSCYPSVCTGDVLRFQELKEFVMCLEQQVNPVGNTCDIEKKQLLIVTGANQGGKSTFLRSIGVAQIMMQCGLPVVAESYESGIFTSFFTHFTRREDSAMNSGRLDEELGRMSRIVDNLGDNAMVLLNESFASTTEKEGSLIAYDIIKALTEAGVKVLTVTHLLSFAQRVYQESGGNLDSGVEFLSAQRMENGRRTFKMIQHAPELTSFGLDLYEEMIGNSSLES